MTSGFSNGYAYQGWGSEGSGDAIAATQAYQRAMQSAGSAKNIPINWTSPTGKSGGTITYMGGGNSGSNGSSSDSVSDSGSGGLGDDFSNTLSNLGITGGLPGLQQQQLGIYKDKANFDYGLQSSAAAQSFGYQSKASTQQYGQNLGLQQDQEKANQSLSDSQQQFQNQRQQMSQDFQTQTQNTQNNYNLGIMAANRAAAGNAFNLNFGGN